MRKQKVVSLTLKEEELKILEEKAKALGMSRSAYIRHATIYSEKEKEVK